MPTNPQYAVLAANAYAGSAKVVDPLNEILPPTGWDILESRNLTSTGFLARAYKNGTEIVIAYGGTTFEEGMKARDWTNGNIPGATGASLATQIVDAAKFYLDVLKDPANAGATISFTGHSLGGGLASLMAVFFDKPAKTFDQAPFEQSATSFSVVNALKQRLSSEYDLAALAREFVSYVPGVTNYQRESQVHLTYVKGEILRNFPLYVTGLAAVAGGPLAGIALGGLALASSSEIAAPAPIVIDPKAIGPSGTDLHDMRLLVAMLQSPALLSASQSNPDFLQQVFKSPLYADREQDQPARNFLNLMIQQEALGNKPLDKLAEDIAKFKGTLDPVANGNVGATDVLKSALYQLAIALYYGEGEKRTGATNDLFNNLIKTVTGGIQFTPDPNRLGDYETALKTVLAEIGSYSPFGAVKEYLKPNAERYTLTTQGALTAAPPVEDSKRDLMLGNVDGDDLRGGGGNDTLLGLGGADRLDGGAGEDTLVGGIGNDTLIGGDGVDTYVINSGDGTDTIIDSGTNRVIFNGKPFVGTFIKNATTGEYEFFDDKNVKL
ncbi:MAG: hypothetical protein Q8J99_20570, partial [Sulfuritalea sp.]|nr:hypothetical protein [Sulfuritalea sp.]